MNSQSNRATRFVNDLEELKIKDPSAGRPVIMIRLAAAVMVISIVLGVVAYFMSHDTTDPLAQRDAIVLSQLAIALAVVSGVVYLRFALTNFLRFWLARQSFDLQMQSEYLADRANAATTTTTTNGYRPIAEPTNVDPKKVGLDG